MFGFVEYQERAMLAAAKALAAAPFWAEDDPELQMQICAENGLIFENMTDDEREYLYHLADRFRGRK